MRLSIVLLAVCLAHSYGDGIIDSIAKVPEEIINGAKDIFDELLGGGGKSNSCSRGIFKDYKKSINKFYSRLYNQVAAYNDCHFVFSPITVWLSLAALAEGADPSIQSQLFSALYLPQEACVRDRFYDIALNLEKPGKDVSLRRRRSMFLQESVTINPEWERRTYRKHFRLLFFNSAPIQTNPNAASQMMGEFLSTRTNLVVSGNSIILDYLDFEGMWTYAFSEASIHRQPFFDEARRPRGYVEMMTMRRRVRLAHVPFMNAKVLELPVGKHGRYTMLFAIGNENSLIKDAINIFMGSIMEIFPLLRKTSDPIDIAIPRFSLTSEFNLRRPLEDIGIREYWMNPLATRFVSNPPAAPGGLIQRVSIRIDSRGLKQPKRHSSGLLSGIFDFSSDEVSNKAKRVGHDFVADRPFIFALFDTKTHTCLFAGAYSKPDFQPNFL